MKSLTILNNISNKLTGYLTYYRIQYAPDLGYSHIHLMQYDIRGEAVKTIDSFKNDIQFWTCGHYLLLWFSLILQKSSTSSIRLGIDPSKIAHSIFNNILKGYIDFDYGLILKIISPNCLYNLPYTDFLINKYDRSTLVKISNIPMTDMTLNGVWYEMYLFLLAFEYLIVLYPNGKDLLASAFNDFSHLINHDTFTTPKSAALAANMISETVLQNLVNAAPDNKK
jgi:hypothetical protein